MRPGSFIIQFYHKNRKNHYPGGQLRQSRFARRTANYGKAAKANVACSYKAAVRICAS